MKKTFIILLILPFLFSCSMDEGGVTVSNNMEKYAIEYIEANQLLEEGEKIIAYYDYTISLDGTESVMLTDNRLLYHNAETYDSSVLLENITTIDHREEGLIGHIIEVYDTEGNIFMIEIAPLNGGDTFLKLLKSRVSGLEDQIL